MHRRAFMLAGSGVVAAASTASACASLATDPTSSARPPAPRPAPGPAYRPPQRTGLRRVTLSGWLVQPNADHPHLFALVKHPAHARRLGSSSVDRARLSLWVLPKDTNALVPGAWVRLRGDVQVGTFQDAVSGYRARAILLGAEPA